jgi:hypothetical protein
VTKASLRASVNPPPQDGLQGPADGAWSRTDAGAHGGRLFCAVCKTGGHTKGWRYYVGLVAHVSVCDECAEGMVQ